MRKGSFNRPASQPAATVRKENEWCRHMGKHVHEKFVHHWCHIEWAVLFVCACICLACMCRRCCCCHCWWWTTCCSLSILFLVRNEWKEGAFHAQYCAQFENNRCRTKICRASSATHTHTHNTMESLSFALNAWTNSAKILRPARVASILDSRIYYVITCQRRRG